ncbi:MAG TPA: SIMPL domain-containing protein [Patescibacteria group bacterium]|nr:SIMPL domain-containing protein [Patescibacteria group bacterium]
MAKIDKSTQNIFIVIAGIILLAVIGILAYSNFSSANTVTGNGQATIKVTPDLVGVYFSVQANGATSQQATSQSTGILNNLTNSLIGLGFNQSQIQTSDFNVYPNYNYNNGQQTQNGYTATYSVGVEMPTSDSSKIGSVIDAGVSAGAGISYINFELSPSKENNYKAQALTSATQDARTKAQAIATGLGKNLGRLVSVTDNSFNYSPWPIYASGAGLAPSVAGAEAKSAAQSITPSQQDVTASVTAVYKLS